MHEPDPERDERDVTRRTILRTTAAGTASVPLLGSASADDSDPTDDPLPVEDPPAPFVCDPENTEHYTEVSAEPTHDFGEERTIELDSEQDGRKIQLGVLLPDLAEDETAPVILRATPYVDDLREKSLRDCVRTERLTENYVQQGYAVAAVAVRGTGGSGGCMELFGPNEQADVDQAVTHLGEAEWSNGNVGIIGRSYDGSTPWMAARMGNPHLATVVPFSGVSDIHDLMYHRGAPEPRGYAILPGLYYAISLGIHSPASGTGVATYLERASCPDNYAEGSVWSSYSGATGERDPSGYWTERILKRGVARNYEGSVLMVHGLQDWNVNPSQVFPWTKELREAGIETHVYFKQFSHRYPDDGRIRDTDAYNENWADFALAWFESELKERDEAIVDDEIETVDVFEDSVHAQHSGGEWYTADEWPPAEAEETEVFLGTDEELRATPGPETGEEVVYVDETRPYDPTQPSDPEPGCRACATFVSEPFASDFRFAGKPELTLTVTPTSSGGHLTAYLWAVDDSDAVERLGWGQIDLRYADDTPAAEYPTPGEELDVTLPIEPLDAVVPEGHRLAVVIHQGTTGDRTYSPTPAPVVVETGGDNAMSLRAWNAEVPRTSIDVLGNRADSGSVFTGGQTNRTELDATVRRPDGETVLVRDTVPENWTVDEEYGDTEATTPATDGTHVYFGLDTPRTAYEELVHFADAPDELDGTGDYTFGPVAVATDTDDPRGDDDRTLTDRDWRTIDGTDRDVTVVAEET